MKENQIAKTSFFVGITFIASIYIIDASTGLWDYTFSEEASLLSQSVARAYWGIGATALFVNLFLMWRHMYRKRQWGWFFAVFITGFVSTLLYYKISYAKK